MGFDKFYVELEPNVVVYFPGQQVRGRVIAVVSSEAACREIKVEMRGKGSCCVTEERNRKTHVYEDKETYTEATEILWRGPSSNSTFEPGEHAIPFVFVLPQDIPGSFTSTYGSVNYKVKATAEIPMGRNKVHKAEFYVHRIYDLNRNEIALRPLTLRKNSCVVLGCFGDCIVSFDMRADRCGYVPGEIMYISGTVWNQSRLPVKYTEVRIVQDVTYITPYKTKEYDNTMERVYRPSIRPGGKDKWICVSITIPAIPVSRLEQCKIIRVGYRIKFIPHFAFYKGPSAHTELIIGSVAIRGNSTYSGNAQHPLAQVERRPHEERFQDFSSIPLTPRRPYGQDAPPYGQDAPPYGQDVPPYGHNVPPYHDSDLPTYEETRIQRRLDEDDDDGGFLSRPQQGRFGNYRP